MIIFCTLLFFVNAQAMELKPEDHQDYQLAQAVYQRLLTILPDLNKNLASDVKIKECKLNPFRPKEYQGNVYSVAAKCMHISLQLNKEKNKIWCHLATSVGTLKLLKIINAVEKDFYTCGAQMQQLLAPQVTTIHTASYGRCTVTSQTEIYGITTINGEQLYSSRACHDATGSLIAKCLLLQRIYSLERTAV